MDTHNREEEEEAQDSPNPPSLPLPSVPVQTPITTADLRTLAPHPALHLPLTLNPHQLTVEVEERHPASTTIPRLVAMPVREN